MGLNRFPRAAASVCLALLLLPAMRAAAQSATQGALQGSVAAADGSALAGAVLRLESETHTAVLLTAASDGSFSAPALDPGRWTVTLVTPAPAPGPPLAVEIAVGRTTTLPLLVAPRRLEYVTVTAQTYQDDAAALAANITPEEIRGLPVYLRRWNNFALLAPTAAPDTPSGDISFRALSGLLNYRSLDGAANAPAFAAEDSPRSRVAFTVSQSAVREFQVNVANYSAQYGRAAGAVIDTVTQRGGENFHGAAFFYDRDNSWLARTPAVALYLPQPDGTLVPQPLPSDWRREAGFAMGGPVPGARARAFWHDTFDREDRDFPALSTVTNAPQLALSQALPSDSTGFNPAGESCAALTAGGLRSTGSETQAALYGTQGACFLNLYDSTLYPSYALAAAAYNNALANVYSLLGQAPRSSTLTSNLPRVDLALTPRNALNAEWNRVRSVATAVGNAQPYVDRSVTSLGDDRLAMDDVSARLNTLLSPAADNEARAGYARDSESQYAQPPLAQEPHTALAGAAAPGVRIRETLTLGTPPQLPRQNYPRESRAQFADALAVQRGARILRLGADLIHTTDAVAALRAAAGDYRYDNMQDYLIDFASQSAVPARHCGASGTAQYLCYSSYEQGFGQPSVGFSGNLWAAYAQQDWRVTPGFTLSLGLRYDYQRLPAPLYPNPALPATQALPADRNNFAPRFGFAAQLPGQRLVARGGYGLFYGTTPATTLFAALLQTGVLSLEERGQARYSFAGANIADAPRYPQTLAAPPTPQPGSGVPAPNVMVLARNFQQPQVQQASLTLEYSAAPRTVIEATGMLSLARELPIVVDTNLPVPGADNLPATVTYSFTGGGPLNGQRATFPFFAGPRPNPNFGAINTLESRVNSTYSALIFSVRHQAAAHLDLRAHYTWAHAMDFGQQTSAAAAENQVLDPYDFALERGASMLDHRNRFVGAAVWQTAFGAGSRGVRAALSGWQISAITQIASGAPYSAIAAGTAPAQPNATGSQNISPTSYGYLGAGGADYLPQLGRNSLRLPPTQVTDVRLAREAPLPHVSERVRFRVALEAFNVFNHRNVAAGDTSDPVNTIAYRIGSNQAGAGTAAAPALATWQPNFGQPVSANATNLFTSRQLQVALRAEF